MTITELEAQVATCCKAIGILDNIAKEALRDCIDLQGKLRLAERSNDKLRQEIADRDGIILGLQDALAGRIKSFEQVQRECNDKYGEIE